MHPQRAGVRVVAAITAHAMSRIPLAVIGGTLGFIAYVLAATIVADRVLDANAVVQLLYFAVVGFVWVFPVRWLMLWAAHKR